MVLLVVMMDRMIMELERRMYTKRTIGAYVFCVEKFLTWVKKHPRSIRKDDIRNFLYNLVKKGRSSSTVNLHLSAIKFYFQEVLKRNMRIDFKHSKRPKRIVGFLTKEEMEKLFDETKSEKYWLIIALMYGAGLRVSEVLALRINDLNIGSGYGLVRAGKGNKDRIITILKIRRILVHFIPFPPFCKV